MTDGDRIMEAIRAAPEDDALRLVWADWCEEQGDTARAQLVRVQLRMEAALKGCECGAAMRWHADDCPAQALRLEEAALLPKERLPLGWSYPWWPNATTHGTGTVVWRRGFAWAVHCRVGDQGDRQRKRSGLWLDQGPAFCAEHPVRHVRLRDCFPGYGMGPEFGTYWLKGDGTVRRQMRFERYGWLPDCIFDRLPPGMDSGDRSFRRRGYATRDEALLAVSQAAIAWARAVCTEPVRNPARIGG